MAFGFFMNMEKLALTIAQKHIDQMSESNVDQNDPPFFAEDALLNNLENGFVAITQMSCFIESFLNTIMNSCMGCEDETLLKCNVNEKIAMIFLYYKRRFDDVKSRNCWEIFRKTARVRNEMIHFKKTYIGVGSDIPSFTLSGEYVADFFTRGNMQKMLAGHVELAKRIADELGLEIFEDINIFECDARDGLVNYVYDSSETYIDETRFEE